MAEPVDLTKILYSKILLINVLRGAFFEVFKEPSVKMARKDTQNAILDSLDLIRKPALRSYVTEALEDLGYKVVKNQGKWYYRKLNSERWKRLRAQRRLRELF